MTKRHLFVFFFCVPALFASSSALAVPGKVLGELPSPGPAPTGLAFDGDGLWVADRRTDLLYKVGQGGIVLKTLETPGFLPSGLAFDGKRLWVSDMEEGKIFQLDPEDGTSLKVIDAPTPKPVGLAWDGKHLWVADEKERRLIKIDQRDGTVLKSFKSPSNSPTGLAFDGRYLWVADRKEDLVFLVSPEHECVIFSFKAPGPFSYGLAFDGQSLWNADYQEGKLYKLVLDDGESAALAEGKKERIEVSSFILNYGPSELKSLKAFLSVPADRENQKLLSEVSFSPQPKSFVNDQYGQKFALFEFSGVKALGRVEIRMSVDAEIKSAAHYIYPHKVGKLSDIPEEIRSVYLKDSIKYDIHNETIQQKVKEAVGEETNPYWIARKLFNWLIAHMEYKLSGGWETAPQVLKRGSGSCSEYTFSYLALTRAAGIPSRYVGSYVMRGDDASWDDVFHRWAEVYLPGYGWIPVDANAGDKEEPFKQAQAFGGIENRFLISTTGGGDSKYMDWGYNLRQEWTASGKTKVRAEDAADWSPMK
ncbi:MAG: transglutaminase [Elusimicrobia bacterium]|nr:transglutaminase [Elusimicrobiota bacterium]